MKFGFTCLTKESIVSVRCTFTSRVSQILLPLYNELFIYSSEQRVGILNITLLAALVSL